MSPRSRFRAEMARRGYGAPASSSSGATSGTSPSSADLFFRLFQLPSASQSSSNNNNNTATSSTSPNSGGGGFRFFNLGGGPSSTNDLDSDLSSDEDEAQWNHNFNSLAHSLPFFLGMRGTKALMFFHRF